MYQSNIGGLVSHPLDEVDQITLICVGTVTADGVHLGVDVVLKSIFN